MLQVVTGAALGVGNLVIVEQARSLEPAGDSKYRPAGKWVTTRSDAKPIAGLERWRPPPPPTGAGGTEPVPSREAEGVIDSLPADVRPLLGYTPPYIATAYLHDGETEDIHVLVIGKQIIAVACRRSYGRASGDLAVWRCSPANTSGELSGGGRRGLKKPRLPMLGS